MSEEIKKYLSEGRNIVMIGAHGDGSFSMCWGPHELTPAVTVHGGSVDECFAAFSLWLADPKAFEARASGEVN